MPNKRTYETQQQQERIDEEQKAQQQTKLKENGNTKIEQNGEGGETHNGTQNNNGIANNNRISKKRNGIDEHIISSTPHAANERHAGKEQATINTASISDQTSIIIPSPNLNVLSPASRPRYSSPGQGLARPSKSPRLGPSSHRHYTHTPSKIDSSLNNDASEESRDRPPTAGSAPTSPLRNRGPLSPPHIRLPAIASLNTDATPEEQIIDTNQDRFSITPETKDELHELLKNLGYREFMLNYARTANPYHLCSAFCSEEV